MPSPFPGMNPYLENPTRWTGTHLALIGAMRDLLNEALPEDYAADADERCQIVPTERSVYPDVFVTRLMPAPSSRIGGATAVLDAPTTPLIIEALPAPPPAERFLEIRHASDWGLVVTAIEILSPGNKTPNSEGRRMYLRKQEETLRSQTHFIEIDLLRDGPPTVAALEIAEPAEPYDYIVCLHRGGDGARFEVWPNRLRERLPKIRIPLLPGDPDLIFDLQAVIEQTYNRGRYHQTLRYHAESVPPLAPEDAEWADALLREKGLRP